MLEHLELRTSGAILTAKFRQNSASLAIGRNNRPNIALRNGPTPGDPLGFRNTSKAINFVLFSGPLANAATCRDPEQAGFLLC